MNKEKIVKINSKYLLNNIFSFVKYEKALKIMKYNKALQNKLNIKWLYYWLPIYKKIRRTRI